ncbi:MAG: hypothetical protein V9G09_14275 [Candidatus Nanopelagicales bacterium]
MVETDTGKTPADIPPAPPAVRTSAGINPEHDDIWQAHQQLTHGVRGSGGGGLAHASPSCPDRRAAGAR